MAHKNISILLVLAMAFPLSIAAQSKEAIKYKRQLNEWGANSYIKLRLRTEEKMEGVVTEVKSDSFILRFVGKTAQIDFREIAYDDLNKLSRVNIKSSSNSGRGLGVRATLIVIAASILLVTLIQASGSD